MGTEIQKSREELGGNGPASTGAAINELVFASNHGARIGRDVVDCLRDFLDKQGLAGKYVILPGHAGGSLFCISADPEAVADRVHKAFTGDKGLARKPYLAQRVNHSKIVDALNSGLGSIRINFDSSELDGAVGRVAALRGVDRDVRLQAIDQVNEKRKQAIRGIVANLVEKGLEGQFVVPQGEWHGTGKTLTLVCTDAVRVALRDQSKNPQSGVRVED